MCYNIQNAIKGGDIIVKVSSITKDTKFYICEYGIFYEGQILEEYVTDRGNWYYSRDVILDKFIIHYKNYLPTLHFRFSNFITKEKWTLPVEHLGIQFRIKK